MAFILLDVPYVPQLEIGTHVAGYGGHSESNGCWYASSCMVGYFWEAGPRLGVPAQYAGRPTDPLPMGARYAELALNEGFTPVPLPSNSTWTADGLMEILGKYGPCYVRRGFRNATGALTGGHIIVLIGANATNSQVAVLDPWNDAANPTGMKFFTTAAFTDFFKWSDTNAIKYSMMYKKQANAVTARRRILEARKDIWADYRR
jgi:hypothetical protein